jgi:hypothetical protein
MAEVADAGVKVGPLLVVSAEVVPLDEQVHPALQARDELDDVLDGGRE